VIGELQHEPEFPLQDAQSQAAVGRTLKTLIHALIHQQSKIDEREWYEKTIEALDATKLVPDSFKGESRRSLLCSLFSEVVVLTTMSHAIHIIFLAMGREIPPLPTLGDMEHLSPSLLDTSSLLREGVKIRDDPSVCTAPFVFYTDFDPNLLEKVTSPEERAYLSMMLRRMPPFIAMGFSPHDMFMQRLLSVTIFLEVST
jgi:hypothetical protein